MDRHDDLFLRNRYLYTVYTYIYSTCTCLQSLPIQNTKHADPNCPLMTDRCDGDIRPVNGRRTDTHESLSSAT
jgi:hypothetical protein